MALDYVIVSQVTRSGYAPTGPFIEYLKTRRKSFVAILHPFSNDLKEPSRVETYRKGKLVNSSLALGAIKGLGNQFLAYFAEFFFNIWRIIRANARAGTFVGFECLAVTDGIILRRLGFFEKVVYYNVDYSRRRFGNPILDWAYNSLDAFAANHADEVWNVSRRACEARVKGGISKKVVHAPNGVHLGRIPRSGQKDRFCLVYAGHVQKEKGLQDIIAALPEIIKAERRAKLVVIGDGEYLAALKQMAKDRKLERHVAFLGRKTNEEVLKIVDRCGIGLAPYKNDRDYVYYSDPVKVKEYLACGCPVIISGVPEIADEIEQSGVGIVASNGRDIADAYRRLLDAGTYRKFSERTEKFASKYDWYKLYDLLLRK